MKFVFVKETGSVEAINTKAQASMDAADDDLMAIIRKIRKLK